MNSTQLDIVKALIEKKKYDVITEYAHVCHPEKGVIVVNEYAGNGVRVYKDNKGQTRVLCPKNISVVQEGHVAQAIANGTIFDDADEVDNNATMIERTSIPYDAMVNAGKETPKQLKPMIAIIIGKMDDNGSFSVSDADRENGVNFVRDLCDKEKCPETNDVVDHYLDKDKDSFYSPEMGKSLTELDNEVDDIVSTSPEDVVSDNDTVDSYDDYNMEEIESDPVDDDDNDSSVDDVEDDSSDGVEDTEDTDDTDDGDDDTEETADDDDDTVEECGDTETVEVCEADNPANPTATEKPKKEITDQITKANNSGPGIGAGAAVQQEEANPAMNGPTEGSMNGNVNTVPMPMSAQTKALINSRSKYHQEGFLTKKPKKLKPIGRDVVAYITVEMNDIHSANDQAMLAGYTCSKIELVDFYITCLDSQDARYIVPHNKQYLVQMKNDLERLLAQILKIRPINRTEQIWRVNYPTT
jgi:hypothetical protein